MPQKHRYYDPIVQTGAPEVAPVEEPQVRAMVLDRTGLWLHVDDVVTALIYGQQKGATYDDILAYFKDIAGYEPEQAEESVEPIQPVGPFEQPDPSELVARVEIFPDAEGKWFARSVDATGTILDTRNGSFDKDYVIAAARDRWPGKEIHELPDAQMDSIWEEEHASFGWNGRRRPSPKRLWAGLG